ncbi:MAG: glycosyltransferase family 2 protein [Campylobacteraceae bacterium]|nr:glycosyltransferase family 2 protein [Campylobacteraceae bacterium]
MLNSSLVSIIIPVYNVEKYLKKCIDSIINQTYENLEIILVNDGSSDNSPRICDEYASQDSRIKVIHKENGGQADARNMALDVMRGEWVVFVDSDDFVGKYYVENLYYLVKKYNVDIGITSYRYVYEDKKISINSNLIGDEVVFKYSKSDSVMDIFYAKYCDVVPWGKIFKRKMFDNVRFPKGKIYEDLATIPLVFSRSNSVAFCNKKDYFYLQRSSSTMKICGNKRDFIIFDVYKDLEQYFSEDKKILKAIKIRKTRDIFMLLYKFRNNLNDLGDKFILINKTIKENFWLVMKSSESTLIDKGQIFLYKFFGLKFFLFFKYIALSIRKNMR